MLRFIRTTKPVPPPIPNDFIAQQTGWLRWTTTMTESGFRPYESFTCRSFLVRSALDAHARHSRSMQQPAVSNCPADLCGDFNLLAGSWGWACSRHCLGCYWNYQCPKYQAWFRSWEFAVQWNVGIVPAPQPYVCDVYDQCY